VLTEKEKTWLIRLARFLQEHEEYSFQIKADPKSGAKRIILSFPYGAGLKGELDKDRKNFDYRLNAILNHKLHQAIYLIVYIEQLFPSHHLVKKVQELVAEDIRRELRTI